MTDLAIVHEAASQAFSATSNRPVAVLGDIVFGATAYSGKVPSTGASVYSVSLSFGASGLVGICFAGILAIIASIFGTAILACVWTLLEKHFHGYWMRASDFVRREAAQFGHFNVPLPSVKRQKDSASTPGLSSNGAPSPARSTPARPPAAESGARGVAQNWEIVPVLGERVKSLIDTM